MSIGSISGNSAWWAWQNQAKQGASANATTAANGTNNSANTGTSTATANTAAFMQAFSADLQSILSQAANSSAATPTSSATGNTVNAAASSQTAATTNTDATSQTANAQASGEVHHHHHQHGGEGDSMQGAADQLVGEIGQSLQSGTPLTTSQINRSASLFASDVAQALQSYGTTAANAGSTAPNAPAQSMIV